MSLFQKRIPHRNSHPHACTLQFRRPSMRIRPTEPEPRAEIVRTRQERRIRRRMHNVPDRSVVAQRHQMQTRRIARVPRAQRRCRLVGEQHIVLGVVEHRLRGVLLFAGRAGAGVRNQAAAGAQLPQLNERVLAGRQQVLAVARKEHRTHFGAVVRLRKRVDAASADGVPQLDRTVAAAGRVDFRIGRILDGRHAAGVLLRWYGAHIALGRHQVVHADDIVIGADGQIVAGRMERQTAHRMAVLRKNFNQLRIRNFRLPRSNLRSALCAPFSPTPLICQTA